MRKIYGLVGRNISYSFSKSYFTEKFKAEGIRAEYQNFDIPEIEDFSKIKNIPKLAGLNVTIPYKEQIIQFLDDLDAHAQQIGAVNTIKFHQNGNLTGYNSDFLGFKKALAPFLLPQHKKAMILGSGGASKAIIYALQQLNIEMIQISREKGARIFSYSEIDKELMESVQIVVNCTPLGTFPDVEAHPLIPMEFINKNHLVFDLIYNPSETKLMQLAKNKGAKVSNGLKMLEFQAEEAWKIWNFQK